MSDTDSKCEYASLKGDHEDRSSTSEDISNFILAANQSRRRRSRWIAIIVIFELVQLLAFGLVVSMRRPAAGWPRPAPDVNGYSDLAVYNTTMIFSNDNHMVEASEFADHFWETFMPHSAVVAINVDDVKAQGIPESGISPTNPREMLYQIDGFHELHCLLRLRRLLLGTAVRTDHAHTLHCLNYIRQTLMCNLDFTLGTTTDYENYGLTDKRVCRDYDAIVAWTKRNNWKDFEQYQSMKTEHHLAELAANNGTRKESYKSPY